MYIAGAARGARNSRVGCRGALSRKMIPRGRKGRRGLATRAFVLPFDIDVTEMSFALFVDIKVMDAHDFFSRCSFPVASLERVHEGGHTLFLMVTFRPVLLVFSRGTVTRRTC